MFRLKINDNYYRILNNLNIKTSNNEVTFNNITIDFSNATYADIPYKYQEVQVLKDDEVVFIGFLDSIKLNKLNSTIKKREMTLTLLSPLKLATKRCINLVGTYELKEAISRILQPLIDDGYTIDEINVPESQITVSFILETIENAMNNVSNKKNLFWFIDHNKKIKISSIDILFGNPIKKEITEEYEKGLLELQPTIQNIDYANVINIKNIRLFYHTSSLYANSTLTVTGEYPFLNLPKTVNKGDIVSFINPIVIDEDTSRMILNKDGTSNISSYGWHYVLFLSLTKGSSSAGAYIYIDLDKTSANYMKYIVSSNISFNDSEGAENLFVLQRDIFFPNMITGFKWNGDDGYQITTIESNNALRYTTMKFMYSPEINKLKGLISNSGQIEKTIDFNSQWTTDTQLINYARSQMQQNSNFINEVTVKYEINPELKIGDIISINRPDFFIQGNFAVKKIDYTYYNELQQNWTITLKKSDFISSYIDLFRPIQKQEVIEQIDTVILSEFVEEQITESHEINLG